MINSNFKKDSKKNDNSWDYRVRIRATANVNDRTTVTYGLSSNNINFGSDTAAIVAMIMSSRIWLR
jgi:hypothetical protein